jgi:hypothetical protein
VVERHSPAALRVADPDLLLRGNDSGLAHQFGRFAIRIVWHSEKTALLSRHYRT